MNLVNVRDGFVTLELLPDDCIVLAAACEAAYWNLATAKDPRMGALLMAFAVALDAAAMAASEDKAPLRSLAYFRREYAADYPDGAPPPVRGEPPPAPNTPPLLHLAAD